MNITVYLGAKEGNDPALKRAVQELGQWIGQSGNALVYGGSKTGLMGEIAKSVLDAGGTVTGVETTLFMQVLPKAGLGWLGVFAVTIIIVAAVELLEHFTNRKK